jgi:alpha-L-fucosidase
MKYILTVLFAVLLMTSCKTKPVKDYNSVASPQGTEVFQPDWENISANYQFPDWFTDGKFGIFIHWGPYAVAGRGVWYPHNMYNAGNCTTCPHNDSRDFKYHVKTYGEHTKFGYKDFIPLFKAEKFDADEWVALFKASGAKYVVPVAEHHDGFAMYDSDRNEWNSVRMGPKKDIIALLKTATEKEGLVFGLSTHRLENAWFYQGGLHFPSDVQDSTIALYGRRLPNQGAYDDAVGLDWLAHTHELIDKYQPQLIWFDWTVYEIQPYVNKFFAYYYNNALDWNKGVVVNTKQGYPNNIQAYDVERGKSGVMRKYPWQTDTSIGKNFWGYAADENNKTPEQIVHDLIDIVSKNGNLLLNIGPRADGTITEEQQAVLLSIGKWLNINGDAIYGTRCWAKHGEGSVKGTSGTFTDNEASAYTTEDMRFTTKGNDFYAIVLNWGDEATVKSLNKDAVADAKIMDVKMLGSNEKINWKQTDKGLQLSFPKEKPCEYAYSFKITFDKKVGSHLPSEMVDAPPLHYW